MMFDHTHQTFFSLLRAGLWEQDVILTSGSVKDLLPVYQLAEEQSVVGLMAAGLEHMKGEKPSQEELLSFVGIALQLEQRNLSMNHFIELIIDKLRIFQVYTLLVKGQGIAQCYERPLWRSSGDIDLFLNDTNYKKAKEILLSKSSSVEPEDIYEKHLGLTIYGWSVELHGSLRSGVSHRLDKQIDEVQKDVFFGGDVRSWWNGNTQVFLPGINSDVFFVFTHILKHFFKEGVGLRQICDWCRLLWCGRKNININLLEMRLRKAGVITEWKAFAAVAVDYLGMPIEAMPLYSSANKWSHKANRILKLIFDTGSFGHNRDNSNRKKYSFFYRKTISFLKYSKDTMRHFFIFPLDSIKAWLCVVYRGLSIAAKGR